MTGSLLWPDLHSQKKWYKCQLLQKGTMQTRKLGLWESLEFCSWESAVNHRNIFMAPLNPMCWSFNLDMTKAAISADNIYPPLHPSPKNYSWFPTQSLCLFLNDPLPVLLFLYPWQLFNLFAHILAEGRDVWLHTTLMSWARDTCSFTVTLSVLLTAGRMSGL